MHKSSSNNLAPSESSFQETYGWGLEVDQNGRPVERSKRQYPYSYSTFVTWRKAGTAGPGAHAVYSDRLVQWDYVKYNSLCQKHFGDIAQMWASRSPSAIEAFLRDYFGKEALELQLVMEGCNAGNGFPVWVFYYSLSTSSH